MGIRRRSLLKQIGLMGVVLGCEFRQEMRSLKSVLAQSTERKLALLIGINQYTDVASLKGAVTDVELQRDLLINRFGFGSQDILTLTDTQATGEAIETAFLEHLTRQAKTGDIVLVHYSGYGREVTDPQGKVSRSLAVLDKDILETTLLMLTRTLSTVRLTLVLDTSFHSQGQPLQGDLRIRSHPETQTRITTLEDALQNQLSQSYKLTTKPPGVILSASKDKQAAAEITINGFNAGLFTYALTQYLWQGSSASRLWMTLGQTSQTVATWQPTQQPQITEAKEQSFLTYFATPQTEDGAEAFVTAIDEVNNGVQIKLTGLSAYILSYSGINSCYSLASDDSLVIQVKSKEGQMAKGRLLGNLTLTQTPIVPGSLLQEAIRVIPRNIPLIIALDSSLERIERVDATSALSTLPLTTSIVPVGEITADCLLSKLPNQADPSTNTGSTYVIFAPGGQMLPQTVGSSNDALKSAIGRLIPQLKQLLALKLLRLTLNRYSSSLPVRLTLKEVQEKREQILISQETRGVQVFPLKTQSSPLTMPLGSHIQYKIDNLSEYPLTVLLVGLDPIEGIMANFLASEVISPKETDQSDKAVGNSSDWWLMPTFSGCREIYVIAAKSSFNSTKKHLETTPPNKSSYSLDIAQSILEDLSNFSNLPNEGGATASDLYTLDLKSWVTFSLVA